jgi:hypothetical protein
MRVKSGNLLYSIIKLFVDIYGVEERILCGLSKVGEILDKYALDKILQKV